MEGASKKTEICLGNHSSDWETGIHRGKLAVTYSEGL